MRHNYIKKGRKNKVQRFILGGIEKNTSKTHWWSTQERALSVISAEPLHEQHGEWDEGRSRVGTRCEWWGLTSALGAVRAERRDLGLVHRAHHDILARQSWYDSHQQTTEDNVI